MLPISLCERFTSGFAWEKEEGGSNCAGVVITTELIHGLAFIKVLIVDVTVTLGGLIASIDTLVADVCGKEDVLFGLGIQ